MRVATAPTGDVNDTVLDLDATHWARQGQVCFEVTLVDGRITTATLEAGFMHRGAEKLFEVRDYRQGLALANRHDWLAPVGGEILLARAAEDLLGLPVPERARRLRVLLLEVSRAGALLAFLGPATATVGLPDELRQRSVAARERLVDLLEQLSGARMHITYTVVGGVRDAAPEGWCDAVRARAADLVPLADDFAREVPHLLAECDGLGVVSAERARSHGASGVVARASGVPLDLRLTDADYVEVLPLLRPAPVLTGSVAARLSAMIDEFSTTLAVIDELARRAASDSGAVNSPLPKVLRVPVGRSWQWCETPLGAAGGLLESRGDRAPYRYALRTPSFAHAPLLAEALVGHTLAEAPAIVSSFPIVVGDLDK